MIYERAACVFLCAKKENDYAPQSVSEVGFALLTVIITVHAYVFYSLYVINGELFMQLTA